MSTYTHTPPPPPNSGGCLAGVVALTIIVAFVAFLLMILVAALGAGIPGAWTISYGKSLIVTALGLLVVRITRSVTK